MPNANYEEQLKLVNELAGGLHGALSPPVKDALHAVLDRLEALDRDTIKETFALRVGLGEKTFSSLEIAQEIEERVRPGETKRQASRRARKKLQAMNAYDMLDALSNLAVPPAPSLILRFQQAVLALSQDRAIQDLLEED